MKLKAKKCWRCGAEPPEPLRGDAAARHRMNFRLALGEERGDMFAYAHCVTRTLMSEQAVALLEERDPRAYCKCEHQAWEAACERWQRLGPDACWETLGVTEASLVRAEVWRLRVLRRERGLSDDEKNKLKELRKALTSEEDQAIKDEEFSAMFGEYREVAEKRREKREGDVPNFTFKCPFCSAEVRVRGPEREVLHALPACEEFKKDEPPDVFLRRCRERKLS
jgi:hypothetical protein